MYGEWLSKIPCIPSEDTETISVILVCRSRMYMSKVPLLSPETRLDAWDWNATYLPSALIDGLELVLSPWNPPEEIETISVTPVCRSRTYMSKVPFMSPAIRFDASDSNATYLPSALIDGRVLHASACSPPDETDTRSVTPVCRSRTNTSCSPLVSPGTRFEAIDMKATYLPSALVEGLTLWLFPSAGEVEGAVMSQLRRIFTSPQMVAQTYRAVCAQAGESDDGFLCVTEADVRQALQDVDTVWDELYPPEQIRIVHLLVEQVTVTRGGISVTVRAGGLNSLVTEMRGGGPGESIVVAGGAL